jgi:hypothetical protein
MTDISRLRQEMLNDCIASKASVICLLISTLGCLHEY